PQRAAVLAESLPHGVDTRKRIADRGAVLPAPASWCRPSLHRPLTEFRVAPQSLDRHQARMVVHPATTARALDQVERDVDGLDLIGGRGAELRDQGRVHRRCERTPNGPTLRASIYPQRGDSK